MLIDLATELRAHGHAEAAQATARLVLSDAAARPRDQQRSSSLRFDMARASDLLGEDATAASLLDGLLAEAPDDLRFVTYDGLTAAHRGQRERALHAASRLRTLKRPYDRGQTTYARAQLAAALGYAEEALSLLRQSLREGVLYGTALHADPEFASLRSDPAFLVLLAPRD